MKSWLSNPNIVSMNTEGHCDRRPLGTGGADRGLLRYRRSRFALEERPEYLQDLRQQTGKAIRIGQSAWRIADGERAKNRKDDTLEFLH
jgi:hypothetical protein